MVERLPCKERVTGSIPVTGLLEVYPSGQRGQTVNLLAYAFEGSNPSPAISSAFPYSWEGPSGV